MLGPPSRFLAVWSPRAATAPYEPRKGCTAVTSTWKPIMLSVGFVAATALLIGSPREQAAPTVTTFAIGGDATEELSPGVTVSLDLELTNPHGRPLEVSDLRVRLMRVEGPNSSAGRPCTERDYSLGQAPSDLRLTVAPNSTISLSRLGVEPASRPHVGMLDLTVNQDGCQGATLTFRYTATGSLES